MYLGKRRGVASFDTPKAVGEYIGSVAVVGKRDLRIVSRTPLSAGDGLCFIAKDGIIGTNINRVEGNTIEPNRIDGIKPGMEVYRNYDHRFSQSVERSRSRRTIDVECALRLEESGIVATFTDEDGNSATVERNVALDRANNSAKMRAVA